MRTLISLITASFASLNYANAAGGPDQLCMWTIKDKKNTGMNEDNMKGPCTEKVIEGGKFFASVFEVQGRKFKVEYLEETQGAEPFKARVNGKIGTMEEDNRYSKKFIADDLSIQSSYDAVLSDPKLTKKMIQGTWAEDNLKNCNAESALKIEGDTLTKFGGESQCKIYIVGKTTVANTEMIMMKCDNEGNIDYEALSFELSGRGREAYTSGIYHRFKCGR